MMSHLGYIACTSCTGTCVAILARGDITAAALIALMRARNLSYWSGWYCAAIVTDVPEYCLTNEKMLVS